MWVGGLRPPPFPPLLALLTGMRPSTHITEGRVRSKNFLKRCGKWNISCHQLPSNPDSSCLNQSRFIIYISDVWIITPCSLVWFLPLSRGNNSAAFVVHPEDHCMKFHCPENLKFNFSFYECALATHVVFPCSICSHQSAQLLFDPTLRTNNTDEEPTGVWSSLPEVRVHIALISGQSDSGLSSAPVTAGSNLHRTLIPNYLECALLLDWDWHRNHLMQNQ